MRRRRGVDAPGQGSCRKMAAAVTFCRLLGRRGTTALSLPQGARCFGVRTSPTGEKVTHTGQVTAAARRAPEWAEPRLGPRFSATPRAPGPFNGSQSFRAQAHGRPSAPALARRPPRARRPSPWVGVAENWRLSTLWVPRSDGGRAVLLSRRLTDVRGNGCHSAEVGVFAEYVASFSASANSKMRRLLLVTAGRLPVGLRTADSGGRTSLMFV